MRKVCKSVSSRPTGFFSDFVGMNLLACRTPMAPFEQIFFMQARPRGQLLRGGLFMTPAVKF